jgi:signal transduction histidine kinase
MSGVLLFASFYWQTKRLEMKRIDEYVVTQADAISIGSHNEILWALDEHLTHEYQDMMVAALFDPHGRRLAGNLSHPPEDLPVDGLAHQVELTQLQGIGTKRTVVAVARRLADGSLLIVGRGVGIVATLKDIIVRALLLGAVPAVGVALAAGFWISRQDKRRLKRVNRSIERIIQGHVHERLPVQRISDDFDQLAHGVNQMLAEIERLLAEVQGVSDNIAHDLRTPLARVRTMLERGSERATSKEDLIAITSRAITSLDQAQAIITALLRIGEIEGGQRRSAFGYVDVNDIVRETGDLYGPIAEAKQIQLAVDATSDIPVYGDRDLLIEAVVNLVDNAIKFTPEGGKVQLVAKDAKNVAMIRVSDSGPGIPTDEREAVMKRFYRIDKSRHIGGSGLGLSLVSAIVRLHSFSLTIEDADPGCRFELYCGQVISSTPDDVRGGLGRAKPSFVLLRRWCRHPKALQQPPARAPTI